MKRLVHIVLVLVVFFLSLPPLKAQVTVSETHTNNICYGGNTGNIDITVTGGTSPYSYLWNDGILTEDRTNIAAGIYSVTVTDFNGTTATLSISISQGTEITVSKSITNVTCGGGNDGAINLTTTGGVPGYSYIWSDGATTEDRINVTAANYYFTVTDALGCSKTDSANVTQPMGMVATALVTNANCNASNGHIDLTVQYGYPLYTYLWNDGVTTEDRVSLMIGTYTVTVTDSINCSVSLSVTVNQNNNNMNVNSVKVNPSCFGGNNGSIAISHVTGGVGPFTYLWNNGNTSAINTGLTAGTYNVTITSATGCVEVKTYSLTDPPQLNTVLNVIPLTCYGSNNGAILNNPTGGTPPYFYLWNGGAFTQHRMGLAAGTYSVTVSDSKSCTVTASATVQQPLQLMLTVTPNPIACIGGPTGSVTTTVTGGTIPYSYWWGGGITSANLVNVNAGNYSVTVTDANGCQVNGSATIPSYTPLATNTAQVTNVSCFGGNNGAVNITTLNGTGPYTYSWNSGQTTEDISNVPAGNYTVTITDNVGCTTVRSVSVTQPSFPVSISSLIQDANCYGSTDGSITLTINNGTAPYVFNWSDGANTQNRTNIAGGNYTVTVTDNKGCTATGTYTVAQPAPMVIYSVDTNVSCFGGNDGIVHPYITGGFAPYSYAWNVGGSTQVKSNLTAGTYTVTVTDTRGCSVTHSSTLSQPAQVVVTANATNITCNGLNNGSISVSVSGAPSPLNFVWNDGASTQNRSNLSVGSYTVSVTDNNGCVNIASATITQPLAIQIAETHTNAGCSGAGTGSINLSVTGGTAPFSYIWSNGATSQNISNITAGSYSVTVSDANSCSAVKVVTVGQVAAVTASASHTNVSCAAGTNGTITVLVATGTAPYNFIWNDNATTQNRTLLAAGTYSVTITDANNCSAVTTATITEPSALILSYTKQDATCYNAANGSIDLTVTGGTGAYLYSWSNNAQTQDVFSLQAGNYTVTVTDANNCIASTSITITQPNAVSVSTNAVPATCYNTSTASITASATGGTGNYQYNWSNGVNAATLNNIPAGNYTVSVTDANGCSAVVNASVGQASLITIVETVTDVFCYGDNHGSITISATGGAGNYSYLWNTGSNAAGISNLTAATYAVTVTDTNGCTSAKNITVTQPSAIQLTTSVTHAACNGTNTGAIDLSVIGGTGSYQYVWNTGATTQDLTNIPAGTYDVVVTDNNNCAATASVIINEAPALQLTLTTTHITCFGLNNGSITANPSGGSPLNGTTYFYQWSNSETTPAISSLAANIYTVTVTDAANCSATATDTIQEPTAISISETVMNANCHGSSDGAISITTNGGVGPYSYKWSNLATTPHIQNIPAGIYSVDVKDANNCNASKSVTVTEPSAITIGETHTNYACSATKGSINITVNGGTANYSYLWNDGITTATRTQLNAGSYTVTITDAHSCTAFATVVIGTIPALNTSINKHDVTCYSGSNGFVDLTVNGGLPPYNYIWNTGAQTQDLQNLVAGVYDVIIHDANNCAAQTSVTISQPAAIIAATTVTNVSCYAQTTGVVDLTVSGGISPYSYLWSNGKNTQDLTGVSAGTYTVTITDAANCQIVAGNITIVQPQPITATATITSESCHGNDGAVTLSVNGGNAPYTYAWNNTTANNTITGKAAGVYAVTVTDSKGCAMSGTYTIPRDAPLTVQSVIQNTSCPEVSNGAVFLNVTGGAPGYNFNWSNGETAQSLQQLAQGFYVVTVTDAKNCTAVESFNITYNYLLDVNAGEDKNIIAGQSVSLSATTNVDHGNVFNWTPSENIQCHTCANTTANPPLTTQFVIEVTDANGCHAVDSVLVNVQGITPLYIPNAFTPNGDGNNDVFHAYGDDASLRYFELTIFNRWGEKVFESNNLRESWDGTYQGEASPNGVYVYIAKAVYLDGSTKDYKGSITIIR
jgi:gliding motility-associated-like protein